MTGSWAMIPRGSVGEGGRQATRLPSCAERVRGCGGRVGPQPPRGQRAPPAASLRGRAPPLAPLLPICLLPWDARVHPSVLVVSPAAALSSRHPQAREDGSLRAPSSCHLIPCLG